MSGATLEERMAALESEMRELRESIKARNPAPDWLERVIGSMKDEPAFDEVLAHGRVLTAYEHYALTLLHVWRHWLGDQN